MSRNKESQFIRGKRLKRLSGEIAAEKGMFLSQEKLYEFRDTINKEFRNCIEGCATIDFIENKLLLPLPHSTHLLTGEAIVKIKKKYADEMDWVYAKENEGFYGKLYIGKAGIMNDTRAFWQYKLEDGYDYICELEKLVVVAICKTLKYDGNDGNDGNDGKEERYATIIHFENGILFDYAMYRKSELDTVKAIFADLVSDKNVGQLF